jgi:hypothetical protein
MPRTSEACPMSESCPDCHDHRAITDKINLYAELIDTHRVHEAVQAVFTEDAFEDHGEGLKSCSGWTEIGDMLEQATAPFLGRMHLNTNIVIRLDGDIATSRSYYQAIFWFDEGDDAGRRLASADWVSAGVYTDEWRRCDDGWRIARRLRRNMGLSSVVLGGRPKHLLEMREG